MFATKKKLQKIFNRADEDTIDEFMYYFEEFAPRFGIDSELQENLFFAQILTEVGASLLPIRENMNYSVAGLKKTFGYYKKNPGKAEQHGRKSGQKANQKEIAKHAYGNRIGNAGPDTEDGYTFRGGGYIQLTGRANYSRVVADLAKEVGREIDVQELGNRIGEVGAGLGSALVYWKQNNIHKATTIDATTRIINRYTDSYGKRRSNYNLVRNA